MATHRTNQLDINLGRISDPATRDAFQSLVSFVNEMTKKILTNKELKAGRVANADNSVSLEKDGRLLARSINVDGGGEFKVMVVSGELEDGATQTVQLSSNARVLGYCGVTEIGGGASGWSPLTVDGTFRVTIVDGSGESDSVELTNGVTYKNKFNIVIFYTDM